MKTLTLTRNTNSLSLHPKPRARRNDLRVPKPTLSNSRFSRRPIVVDVPQLFPTSSAGEPGPASSKAPVVQSFKKREALVQLLLTKISFVHCRERHCAFVASIKVCVWWVEKLIAEVKTPVASSTAAQRQNKQHSFEKTN